MNNQQFERIDQLHRATQCIKKRLPAKFIHYMFFGTLIPNAPVPVTLVRRDQDHLKVKCVYCHEISNLTADSESANNLTFKYIFLFFFTDS